MVMLVVIAGPVYIIQVGTKGETGNWVVLGTESMTITGKRNIRVRTEP